jgi:hypothetical protein
MNKNFHPLSRFSDYPWDVFDEDIQSAMAADDSEQVYAHLNITGDITTVTPCDSVSTVMSNLGLSLVKEFKGSVDGHIREYQVWWSQGVCAIIQGATSTVRHPMFLAELEPQVSFCRPTLVKLQTEICDKHGGTNLITSPTSFIAILPCYGIWHTLRVMNRLAYVKSRWSKIPGGPIGHYFEDIEQIVTK